MKGEIIGIKHSRQVTKFPPTYVQNPDIDFLSPLSPAYRESEYAST